MTRQSSFGLCEVCGARSGKAAMVAHLHKCLPREGNVTRAEALLIRVQSVGTPRYWMDCAVRIDANLKHLDTLFRRTWLECCGHRSEFSVGDRQPVGMSVSIARALASTEKHLSYAYDFGSTTALVISDLGVVDVAMNKPILMLARNEPPVWPCDVCGAPATVICSQCVYDDCGFCCAHHATQHECGSDMLLPVVNSPRMGVCGYAGES